MSARRAYGLTAFLLVTGTGCRQKVVSVPPAPKPNQGAPATVAPLSYRSDPQVNVLDPNRADTAKVSAYLEGIKQIEAARVDVYARIDKAREDAKAMENQDQTVADQARQTFMDRLSGFADTLGQLLQQVRQATAPASCASLRDTYTQ